ncbi:MAG: RimK family alpha-L-glutamate ligase, partial [Pyrobaculum sp.]
MSVVIVAESQTPDEPTRDIYFEAKKRELPVRYVPIQ